MIKEMTFGGKTIEFDVNLVNGDAMVNATNMAKIFGKRVDVFLKTEHAKAFINVLELTPYGGRSEPLNRDEIVKTRNGVNTFFCRVLAIKFAAWLDPKFEVWVYSTIDELLFSYSRAQDKSIMRAVVVRNEMSRIMNKVDRTVEDFERYLELDRTLKYEQSLRAQKTKNRFREIYQALKPKVNEN